MLGFRTDPDSVLREIQTLIVKLHATYAKSPEFGVKATTEDAVCIYGVYVCECIPYDLHSPCRIIETRGVHISKRRSSLTVVQRAWLSW